MSRRPEPGRAHGRLRAWLVRLALGGLVTLGVGEALVSGFRSSGPDYLQFWVIGRAMPLESYGTLHGKTMLIDGRDRAVAAALRAGQDELYLTATPLFYAVFAWMALADFASSLRSFQVASSVLFVAALIFMLRAWDYSWVHVCLVVAAYCLLAVPLASDAAQGNVSRIVVAMAAVVLWAFRRRGFFARTFGAQALLALLVLFKPLLVLAFPALLVLRILSGRWTHAAYETAGFVSGTVIGVLLPTLLIGAPLHLWQDFLDVQLHYTENGAYEAPGLGDASLVEDVAATLHLSVIQLSALALVLGLAALAIACAYLTARARVQPGNDRADLDAADLAVWLGAAGVLLVSPLVWPHYYVSSIMLLLLLLHRTPEGESGRRVHFVALAGALVLLAGPVVRVPGLLGGADVPTSDAVGRQLALGNLLVCGVGLSQYMRLFRQRGSRELAAELKAALP